MLDQNFCSFLEYRLSDVLHASNDKQVKSLWCDGVLLPDSLNEYSKKLVNEKRQVIMKAFIGKDGQDRYELILQFGKKALSQYARDLDIKKCVPSVKNQDWFYVDISNKQVVIQLH